MSDENTVYGHTESGRPITDELIAELVAEAEAGYDVEKLRAAHAETLDVLRDPAALVEIREAEAAYQRGDVLRGAQGIKAMLAKRAAELAADPQDRADAAEVRELMDELALEPEDE